MDSYLAAMNVCRCPVCMSFSQRVEVCRMDSFLAVIQTLPCPCERVVLQLNGGLQTHESTDNIPSFLCRYWGGGEGVKTRKPSNLMQLIRGMLSGFSRVPLLQSPADLHL